MIDLTKTHDPDRSPSRSGNDGLFKAVASSLLIIALFGFFMSGIYAFGYLALQNTKNELRMTQRLSGTAYAEQRVQPTDWGNKALYELLSQTRTNAVCDTKGFVLPGALRTVSTFDCIDLGDYRIVPDEFAEQAKVYVSRGANISQPMIWDGQSGHLSDQADWEKVSSLLSRYLDQ